MNVDARRPRTRRRSASSGRSSRRRSPRRPSIARPGSEEWEDVAADIGGRGAVWLVEDDEGAAGSLRATMLNGLVWHIVLAYVRPRARQQGLLHALMREALAEGGARGSTRVTLDVLVANEAAVAVWRRLGFEPSSYTMAAPLESVAARLGGDAPPSSGAAYVQTDDHDAVAAGGREVPAADRPLRSHGRRPAEQRLDEGRRRALLRRSEGPSPARPRALAGDGQHRADARDRGERGRPLHPLGPWRDRRRVRIRPGALRPAAARRRRRARREPDGRAAADRRRSRRGCAPSRAPRPRSTSFRRRRSCTRSWPRCSG